MRSNTLPCAPPGWGSISGRSRASADAVSLWTARVAQREGSLRRLLAIGFAAKESSDVDDPHDHSVANAIAKLRPAEG